MAQTRVGFMHRVHLSAYTDKTTARQILGGSIDQLLYLIRYVSKVFAVSVSVDVDYWLDIIVIFNRRGGSARKGGHIRYNLGLSREGGVSRYICSGYLNVNGSG